MGKGSQRGALLERGRRREHLRLFRVIACHLTQKRADKEALRRGWRRDPLPPPPDGQARRAARAFLGRSAGHAIRPLKHVLDIASDQKNGGWRLFERLKWLRQMDDLEMLLPALGTIEAFAATCWGASDARSSLKSRECVQKLLAGKPPGGYTNGKRGTANGHVRHEESSNARKLSEGRGLLCLQHIAKMQHIIEVKSIKLVDLEWQAAQKMDSFMW